MRIMPVHECKGIGIASPKGTDPAGYRSVVQAKLQRTIPGRSRSPHLAGSLTDRSASLGRRLALVARMKPGVDLAEPAELDAGVDLGRGDRGVAEHLLDDAQIGTPGKEVGGEAVPQRVRADIARAGRRLGRGA